MFRTIGMRMALIIGMVLGLVSVMASTTTTFAVHCNSFRPHCGGGGGSDTRMYTVTLNSITAYTIQELSSDEPDLYIGGELVWNKPNFGPGEHEVLGITRTVPSGTSVELWEDDGNRLIDRNDMLGSVLITMPGHYSQPFGSYNSDYYYVLDYTIR
jgi:hypothetical protein